MLVKQETKKIDACTNLSKLNNSSQFEVGIYFPGVQHKIKMTSVQIIENQSDFLRI